MLHTFLRLQNHFLKACVYCTYLVKKSCKNSKWTKKFPKIFIGHCFYKQRNSPTEKVFINIVHRKTNN